MSAAITPAVRLRELVPGGPARKPGDMVARRRASDAMTTDAVPADRRPQAVLIALCVAALAVLWSGLALFVEKREEAVLDRVSSEVHNLAVALEQQVQRTFLGIDQMMRFAEADAEADPVAFDLKAWLALSPAFPNVVIEVAMADAQGKLVSNLAQGSASRASIADRDHFRIQLERPDAGLFIGRGLPHPVSGQWTIQASRRLNRADGSFAGVIAVSNLCAGR